MNVILLLSLSFGAKAGWTGPKKGEKERAKKERCRKINRNKNQLQRERELGTTIGKREKSKERDIERGSEI